LRETAPRRSNSVKKVQSKIAFAGIQIKSEETYHRFCAALSEIEELTGIHEVEIELKDIFFCPWIDESKCASTPMEEMIIGMIRKLPNERTMKRGTE
jgi:hypothetical protein